jgi:hypothetical protein
MHFESTPNVAASNRWQEQREREREGRTLVMAIAITSEVALILQSGIYSESRRYAGIDSSS